MKKSAVPFSDRPSGKAVIEYCESRSAVAAFFVVLFFVGGSDEGCCSLQVD